MGKAIGMVVLSLVAAALLWVVNCSGPRPEVRDVRLQAPESDGAPYRIEVEIANPWRGHGQAAVTIRLIDTDRGLTVIEQRKIALEPDEQTVLVAEIAAPPGRYTPQVEVRYPPR
ncbi:MAG: hypothetical protein U0556_14935 [Dehalococcoidia bacterium]